LSVFSDRGVSLLCAYTGREISELSEIRVGHFRGFLRNPLVIAFD